ncbi:MAG: YhcB family protein [Halomonas sp.]|nr:YhcB family protein [Halomonas sp.]
MESEPLTYAVIGLVIGLIIGAGCYRLLSKSQRQLASLRQTLLEREHQVASLKNGVSHQLSSVHESLAAIRQETDELEKKLQDDAGQWQLDKLTHHPAELSDLRLMNETTSTSGAPATPRDYADGQNGTLSEHFGLKDKDTSDDTATPPRY